MAKNSDHLAGRFENENTGGLLTGFLAEENDFDRRSLWRLGSWGVGAVGAVVVALLANQSPTGWRREQIAAAELTRQSQQIQSVAKESQNETRRLASAIDTLNGDRERLYSRITVLEQGLDSVTGSIARQNAAVAPPQAAPVSSPAGSSSAGSPATGSAATAPVAAASPARAEPPPAAQTPAQAPVVAPVASAAAAKTAATSDKPAPVTAVAEPGPATAASTGQTTASTAPVAAPATPLMAAKSMMAPPDAAAGKLIAPDPPPEAAAAPPETVAAAPDDANAEAVPATSTVQRTEFAVDLGAANTVGGLRALWRGLLKSRSNSALTALRPIIVVKEGGAGIGTQLRLAAGPLSDAAAAAKICAAIIEHQKTCETTVFDGQQLAMKDDDPPPAAARPASVKPSPHRRSVAKQRVTNEEPPKPEPTTTLSSFFGRR